MNAALRPRLQAASLALTLLPLVACDAAQRTPATGVASAVEASTSVRNEEVRMWMTVGARRFAVELADSATARALAEQLPMTLDMKELNGNEKYGELPLALPVDSHVPGTIRNGDVMLYGSDTLVVFYLDFESSYAYTRIGRLADPDGLAQALGTGGITVTFSLD